MPPNDDARWMAAAAALAERARPQARPNPGVGAIVVKDGNVVGRGWTQDGGRPHAEAVALAAAGEKARGGTLYVTLEPCAHVSERGPACADLTKAAGLARVVIGMRDPDARTCGNGIAQIEKAGAQVSLLDWPAEQLGLAGHHAQIALGRPYVTLKLALSLDGCIAISNGESQWITGEAARAHTHRERARADAIMVGGETLRMDNPRLDVRLPGLEARSPQRLTLTRGNAPGGWQAVSAPVHISRLADIRYLFLEGGAGAAAAFLTADLVDRLLIYRAPILIGAGRPGLAEIGLTRLAEAHQRWRRTDIRPLGADMLEIYHRIR